MEQAVELILSDGGWVALAIISLILFVFAPLAKMYLRLGSKDDMSDKTIANQAVTVAQLATASIESQKSNDESMRIIGTALDRMSLVIEKQQTQIDGISRRTDNISQRTDDLKIGLGMAVADMRVASTALSEKVGGVPQEVREVVVPEIEKIPEAIEKILNPKFETLQQGVESVIRDLDIKLKQASKDIADDTEETFNKQLAKLRDDLMAMFRASLADAVSTITTAEAKISAAPAAEETEKKE